MEIRDLLLIADELNFPTEHVYAITLYPNPPKQGERHIWGHIEVQLRKTVRQPFMARRLKETDGVEFIGNTPDRITGTLDGAIFSVWGFA